MLIDNAKKDLRVLVAYLADMRGWTKRWRKINLVWVKDQDKKNLKDPRVFCFTVRNDMSIYCCRALNELPAEARVGVLLHEIGHIINDAFAGSACEVDVDAWCASIKEAGYRYKDAEYINPLTHTRARAKSLETVSPEFVEAIHARST